MAVYQLQNQNEQNVVQFPVVQSLQRYHIMDEVQEQEVARLGLEEAARNAFPIHRLSGTSYFAGSLVAQVVKQQPELAEEFAETVERDKLCLTTLGGFSLPEQLARERIQYLHRFGIVTVKNDQVAVRDMDVVLNDLVHELYCDPVQYDVKVIDAKALLSSPAEKRQAAKRARQTSQPRDSVIAAYSREISAYPLLSAEEERELARQYRDHGSIEAYQRLVQSNLRYVVSMASKFNSYGLGLADRIQAGNIGLLRAAKTFDPDRGVRFVTYAHHWIKQRIARACADLGRNVRLPALYFDLFPLAGKLIDEHAMEHGGMPTPAELAKGISEQREQKTGVKVASTLLKMDTGYATEESLDELISNDDGREKIQRLSDQSPLQDELLSAAQEHKAVRDAVYSIKDPRIKHILLRRSMLDSEDDHQPTLDEVGEELSLSRERIRNLERDGIILVRRKVLRRLKMEE